MNSLDIVLGSANGTGSYRKERFGTVAIFRLILKAKGEIS